MKKVASNLTLGILIIFPMYAGATWLDLGALFSEPATMLLLGVALMGLAGIGRKNFNKK